MGEITENFHKERKNYFMKQSVYAKNNIRNDGNM